MDKPYEYPQVGDVVTVLGVECRVYHVLPAGTVEVEATDGSGRCWRVSGGLVRRRPLKVEGLCDGSVGRK